MDQSGRMIGLPPFLGTAASKAAGTSADNVLLLDSSGRMLLGSQPSAIISLSATKSNVTGGGTDYKIAFDNAIRNVGSSFNTTTYTFTAPVTGLYALTMDMCSLSGITSAMTSGKLAMYKNGSAFQGVVLNFNPYNCASAGTSGAPSLHVYRYLVAGDAIACYLQISGATDVADLDVSGTGSWNNCLFTATLLF